MSRMDGKKTHTHTLLYCSMDTFSPSDVPVCLYKCKESSVHGTISSVGCQNIIPSVLLLYCGPVSPHLCLYKCKESSAHGPVSSVVFQNITITAAVLEIGFTCRNEWLENSFWKNLLYQLN